MKNKLVQFFVKWALGGIFRDVAEGRRGARLKALYWALVGKKRAIGFTLAAVLGGTALVDPKLAAQIAPYVGTIAGLLVGWGLLDAGWRKEKPPAEWAQAFRQVMSFGPLVAGIAALAVEWLPQIPGCVRCDHAAGWIQVGMAAVATATGYLSARFAEPEVRVGFQRFMMVVVRIVAKQATAKGAPWTTESDKNPPTGRV